MELSDLKYLSKGKRLTMANCVLGMIFADGRETDSEWNAASNIIAEFLDITSNELNKNIQSVDQLEKTLRTMDGDELFYLGLLLGAMAKADGVADQKELDTIRGILSMGNLRSDNIEEVIKWTRKLK